MSLRPVVFSGPSGTGKSTLLTMLFKEFPNEFGFSVSHTTRQPRPGEVTGTHYHFTTIEDMTKQIQQGNFIEHAKFSNNMYGTSKQAVQDVLKSHKICLLDVDEQGVKSIKETDLNPLYIFISPPSLEALRDRLNNRGTETPDSVERRMATAVSALQYSEEKGVYDTIIVNDVLEEAYARMRDFLIKHFPEILKKSTTGSDDISKIEQNLNNGDSNDITRKPNLDESSGKEDESAENEDESAETEDESAKSHVENNNISASVAEIPLSPVKITPSYDDDTPAVVVIDTVNDMRHVVTSEKQVQPLVVTHRSSSVIDMGESETTSACGDSNWNWCVLV